MQACQRLQAQGCLRTLSAQQPPQGEGQVQRCCLGLEQLVAAQRQEQQQVLLHLHHRQ